MECDSAAYNSRQQILVLPHMLLYRGVDKSLARPGRKQARKHVKEARFQRHRDASCRQVSLSARQDAEGNSRHSDRNITLFPSWSG